MENNLTLEKVLLVCNRYSELLRLARATFVSTTGYSQKDEEEKFDNSEKFAEKSSPFLVLFVFGKL